MYPSVNLFSFLIRQARPYYTLLFQPQVPHIEA
jgi:hypothetical protein